VTLAEMNGEILQLPDGYYVLSLNPDGIALPGRIWLARFEGDIRELYGDQRLLRERLFALKIGNENWLARPVLSLYASHDGDGTVIIDDGGIHVQASGGWVNMDFELVRMADEDLPV
jgi:hypothetical protein